MSAYWRHLTSSPDASDSWFGSPPQTEVFVWLAYQLTNSCANTPFSPPAHVPPRLTLQLAGRWTPILLTPEVVGKTSVQVKTHSRSASVVQVYRGMLRDARMYQNTTSGLFSWGINITINWKAQKKLISHDIGPLTKSALSALKVIDTSTIFPKIVFSSSALFF